MMKYKPFEVRLNKKEYLELKQKINEDNCAKINGIDCKILSISIPDIFPYDLFDKVLAENLLPIKKDPVFEIIFEPIKGDITIERI